MAQYIGANGRIYTLGTFIGSGTDGTVFEIGGQYVAKIFGPNADMAKTERKLTGMASKKLPAGLEDIVTWPVDLLYGNNGFAGFIMKKMDKKYSFGRLTEYPSMDDSQPYNTYWVLAQNLAKTFDAIHAEGIVIGDANGENIGFREDGIPVIFDCDSFAYGGFPCDRHRPEYVPYFAYGPSGTVKLTEKTDDWALAVHLWELCMNGSHPFACASQSGSVPSIPDCIRSRTCPYFSSKAGRLHAPPYAPSPDILPSEIRGMFEKAFTGDEKDVPTAKEWAEALNRVCANGFVASACKKHVLPAEYGTGKKCPLCEARMNTEKPKTIQNPAPKPAPKPAPNPTGTPAPHTPTGSRKKHSLLSGLKGRLRWKLYNIDSFLWKAAAAVDLAILAWAVIVFLTGGDGSGWTLVAARAAMFCAAALTAENGDPTEKTAVAAALLAAGFVFPEFMISEELSHVLYGALTAVSGGRLLLRWKP